MNICIITPDFPDKGRPVYPFVEQLTYQFASQSNIKCFVIAPYSVTKNKKFHKFKEHVWTNEGKEITIYRPNILSFSNLKIGPLRVSNYFREKAITRVLNKLINQIDIIYCHFWESALFSCKFAKKYGKPLFVATGESLIPPYISGNKYYDLTQAVNGVICVSTKNRDESVRAKLCDLNKTVIIPNGIDENKFKLLDKDFCRNRLGIDKESFVIVFVGSFIDRKGPQRVIQAIEKLEDKNIKSIFIGSGPVKFDSDQIIFKGKLDHNEIVQYLNAGDIFVLPTFHEGCCNAIIEAMACGLPIVSSNLSFNWDILNDGNSILIDPNNIEDISKAINILYTNRELYNKLREGALNSASKLDIKQRTTKILDFIISKL